MVSLAQRHRGTEAQRQRGRKRKAGGVAPDEPRRTQTKEGKRGRVLLLRALSLKKEDSISAAARPRHFF